jgi:hypothetical protein
LYGTLCAAHHCLVFFHNVSAFIRRMGTSVRVATVQTRSYAAWAIRSQSRRGSSIT